MQRTRYQKYFGALSVIILSAILAILAFWWLGYDYGQFSREVMPDSQFDAITASSTLYQASDNLLHRPLDLGYSPTFYGEPSPFAYTIAPYGIAVATLPVYLLSGQDLELTFNLYYLSTFVLTAWAAYILIRYLLSAPQHIAVLMALSVTFGQYRFVQIWHIETLSLQFYILAVYCLHRLIVSPNWRWAVGLAVAFWFTMMTSGYLGMMFIVTAGIIGIYVALKRLDLLSRRFFAAAILSVILSVIISFPFISFRLENKTFSTGYSLEENMLFSTEPREWFAGTSLLYVNLIPAKSSESMVFLGFTPLALALAGWYYRRYADTEPSEQRKFSTREVVVLYSLIVLSGYILSLGPVLQNDGERIAPLPYLILFQAPGISSLRVPARFIHMSLVGIAVLGAYALTFLQSRTDHVKYIIAWAAIALCLTIELIPFNQSGTRRILDAKTPTLLPQKTLYTQTRSQEKMLDAWLAKQPRDTVIFHYPSSGNDPITGQALRIYLADQRLHGLKMINGWGSYLPTWFTELGKFPQPPILYWLQDRNVRYIVVHNEFMSSQKQQDIKTQIQALAADQNIRLPLIVTLGSVDVYDLSAMQIDKLVYDFDSILGKGWSFTETDSSGMTFQWTAAPTATLTFPGFTQVPLLIEFRVINTIRPDILDSLTLQVNGTPIALQRQDTIWSGTLTSDLLKTSQKLQLTFHTKGTASPIDLGLNSDTRQLGICFDWLHLTPLSFSWEFDAASPGGGWYGPETDTNGTTFEWTSAPEVTFTLPVTTRSALRVEFGVLGSMQPDILNSLTLEVSGVPIALTKSIEPGDVVFSGVISTEVMPKEGPFYLVFRTNRTVSPQQLGISNDARQLGAQFDWLRLTPIDQTTN